MPTRWIRRSLVGVMGLVVLVLGAGAGYERVCIWQAWRDFPPPGRLVDVGGRRIQIDCRGTGAPIVVFEAGLDINGSLSWSMVHDAVTQTTRACTYSRAGIMWSDPRAGAHDSVPIAQDLHAVLSKAGEKPPFVLVCHSLGGLYIVTYTAQFPSDVAGLVLVEASHPDRVQRFKTIMPTFGDPSPTRFRMEVSLAWTGVVRADRESSEGMPHQPLRDVRAAAAFAPSSLAALLREEAAMKQTHANVSASHALGDRPTYVLTGATPLSDEALVALHLDRAQSQQLQDMWNQMQEEEASWSSRSQHQVIPDAGHYIQFDRPDAVIAAVRSVVASVRELHGRP